ncbi:uncharacterized protein LOC135502128 isoform X2 [Lineus longissimus]|uniref:uncharacterized protein LOC135502128 isoform X2 n=1 Tax=Lineus longissimus TaxID=88925 RepID=UPI00315D3896
MDGRILHTVLVGVLLFIIACYGKDERATFCLTKSETLNPPINCPKACAPVILIKESKSQILTDCNATSSTDAWKPNDTASHMVWNSCNLRGSSCTPITYHDHSAVRLEVFYTCVNRLSLHRQDLCSDVGFVVPTPFYLHTPGYPKFDTTTTQTNCTCRLLTASGSDITLTVLDMLTSMPESLRIEWNGGREDITTVLDEVGYLAAKRSVTRKGMVVIFKPQFTGRKAYMWIRVETQAMANAPETVLLTCNGKLGTIPTASPTISPSLCPTTTSTTTTTTTTASTTTTTTTTNLPTTTSKNETAPKITTYGLTALTPTGTPGSSFSVYYLVPVIVIVITIIILVVVLVRKKRRERLENAKPVKAPIELICVRVDRSLYLTSGRPKFIPETPGGRAADHSSHKALALSPKELVYFDHPKNTDTLNIRASRSGDGSKQS